MSDITATQAAPQFKRRGQGKDIVRRFFKNSSAVVGLVVVVVYFVLAIFPGQISSPDYTTQNLRNRFQPPSAQNLLGTDEVGRDILTRMVWGTRTSLTISLTAVAIAAVIGVAIGVAAGFFGGVIDNILMRIMDILMAIPNLLLGISIAAALGSSITNLTIAIAVGNIAAFARIARSSVMTVRDKEYIESAVSTGANNWRIIWRYVLPNALAPIIVQVSMAIAGAILNISGLSFVGLGVPAPTPEWGAMLSAGRGYIRDYWWVITFPGVAIMMAVLAFNLLGDGLRDALDPRLKS